MEKVLIVGSAENSNGGVSSVIKLMKKMPVWSEYSCYWLGTQMQGNYIKKTWYAIKANIMALFIIWTYDIVHFHTTPDKLGLLIQLPILLLAKLGNKKTIIHIHVGNQLNNHTKNALFKWWLNHCDLVVVLAKKWRQLLKEKYKDIKTPTTVIYNATDYRTFVPYEERQKYIVYVGSLNPNKAPYLLIKAWAMIHSKYPEWHIKFMGGSVLLEDSKQMSNDLGVKDSVEFLGFCKGDVLVENFSKASIYVMTSYNEGFPMSVIEAWAYGLPVVTTPVGGLPDVIEVGRNCLTFDFGNYNQLADRLSVLIENQKLRERMSTYSRDFVYDNFSLEKISKDIENIYRQLLK